MHDMGEAPRDGGWLKSTLVSARQSNYCCTINCSTCGAVYFQKAILIRWAYVFRAKINTKRHYGDARILQNEFSENAQFRNHFLISLNSLSSEDVSVFFEQLKFIFTNIYHDRTIEWHKLIDEQLFNTAAGMFLEKMKEHHRERDMVRSREAIRNDSFLAQERRERVRESRAKKHAARIEYFSQRGRALGFKKP
jgi:hypothetical protein